MKPIPVVFNIGPLQVHTYGIGLAITFWFGYRYFAKRLARPRLSGRLDGKGFVWIIILSIVGARAVSGPSPPRWPRAIRAQPRRHLRHLARWPFQLRRPAGRRSTRPIGAPTAVLPAVAHGGSSTSWRPSWSIAWAVGRLLGPQFSTRAEACGPTPGTGMYYAGQAGKRVPVPIIQAIECFVIWVIALQIEKFVRRRGGPLGLVVTSVVTLYGLARFFDESVLLPHGTRGDLAVIAASLAFVAAGALFGLALIWRGRGREMPELAHGARSLGCASGGGR